MLKTSMIEMRVSLFQALNEVRPLSRALSNQPVHAAVD